MIGKAASYSLFGAAITKVRRRPSTLRFSMIHWKTLSAREKEKRGLVWSQSGPVGRGCLTRDSSIPGWWIWIFKRICVVCSSSSFVETQRRAASVDAGATGSQSAEGRAADSPATQRVGRNALGKKKNVSMCRGETTNPILSFVSFCVEWCFR